MIDDDLEADALVELAGRRRMSFQRPPDAVSPRRLFDHIQPDGRRRFLVAAVVAFSGRGYHATSTRDIATVAQSSSASLYTYYTSKSQLLYEMTVIGFQYTIDLVRGIVDRGLPPVETMAQIVREYIYFHAEEKVLILVINRDYHALAVGHLAHVLNLYEELRGLLEAVILAGITSHDFKVSDVKLAARATLRLADVSPWFNERSLETLDELAASHVNLVLQMLGRVSED